MNSTKRLFLAIKLNAELLLQVQDLKNEANILLQDRAFRWTAPDNLHLTLLFLGDTNVSDIPVISQVMDECVQGLERFDFEFVGLGCFPNLRKPRIFWMGVDDLQNLRLLYNRIVRGLCPVFDLNRPKFSPHVTLARVKDYAKSETITGLNQLVKAHNDFYFGSLLVEKIILFESDLQAGGPIYKPIHHSMLK